MLENNRSQLHGTDCSDVRTHSPSSAVGRLIMRNLHHSPRPSNSTPVLKDRPRANFYENRNLVDPFPDPSLIDPDDDKQEQEIDQSIGVLINSAVDSGFPKDHFDKLTNICLLYTSPSPRDQRGSRMPSSA